MVRSQSHDNLHELLREKEELFLRFQNTNQKILPTPDFSKVGKRRASVCVQRPPVLGGENG
jgi:hypothetical protein